MPGYDNGCISNGYEAINVSQYLSQLTGGWPFPAYRSRREAHRQSASAGGCRYENRSSGWLIIGNGWSLSAWPYQS